MANAVVVGNLLGKKKESDAFLIGIVTAVFGVSIDMVLTFLVTLNAHCVASLLSPNAIVVDECVRYIYCFTL